MNDTLTAANGIDIIGDIHGHLQAVKAVLAAAGYQDVDGVWRHPKGRKALFIGDLIDRGPENRSVVNLVRNMVENHEAVCLMGNHEFNAVAFATEHPEQHGFLRQRTNKNLSQHIHFLYEHYSEKNGEESHAEDINWFKTLPLFIETEGFRAVHACWSIEDMAHLDNNPFFHIDKESTFWTRSSDPHDQLYESVEKLLKGPETRLPEGVFFYDKDGHERRRARVTWWNDATDWSSAVQGPPELYDKLKAHDLELDQVPFYKTHEKPVFFGHYWMSPKNNQPYITRSPNAACLDFAVARPGGLLGLYQWDGEECLSSGKIISSDCNGRVSLFE